jgi:thymidylate synthase (FAD)
MAGYAQESTRYCNYSKDKFDNQITVIKPVDLVEDSMEWRIWMRACNDAEIAYLSLIGVHVSPQIARSVLPTCLKTEIVMTCDFTEWRHVIALRTSPKAHPDIQYLIGLAHQILHKEAPTIFPL